MIGSFAVDVVLVVAFVVVLVVVGVVRLYFDSFDFRVENANSCCCWMLRRRRSRKGKIVLRRQRLSMEKEVV